MSKLRVDAQWRDDDPDYVEPDYPGDERLEDWMEQVKYETRGDPAKLNPGNPLAQPFENAHRNAVALREAIGEELREFKDDPSIGGKLQQAFQDAMQAVFLLNGIKEVLADVTWAYDIVEEGKE